ncbi:hypothetical protein K450DRAFT_217268 [Umbelopsis ramanniana AG]|uniref:Secreted protein n=1 Tax=Umbelopsis ramanniana AG TaxID=1314678 RepID=A0AAD5HJR9_UMBRA|nr:uncharacterized protein K450DRAFT_217268 [Umbelopsis ramanniana AG]KAI8584643.1 hypothetical protein K450DRAFT_217268 [Umbelopsis ramanniana AG]
MSCYLWHLFLLYQPTHRIVMAAAVVVAVPVCPKESVPEPPKNAGVVCAVCGSRKHMTTLSGLTPNIRVYPAGEEDLYIFHFS